MRGRAALLLLALLAGCSRPPVQPKAALPSVPAGLCRVGADGGIPVADRGIGGTGAPVQVADRGIGGTGARTGIVGVITGFASVCLAGEEVQYGADLPVKVDGRAAGVDTLRAGQVAVVVADGAAPVAVSLAVRHEVSGPVERVESDGTLLVAGQRVLPPPGPAVGVERWVMVSGFRRADGTVVATRLDPRPPGEVLVRGIMQMEGGRLWIGLVEIRPGRFQERHTGVPVVAIGRLNDGVLEADTVEVDALLVDPPQFFGPAVGALVLEGYAEGGVFRFGGGLRADAVFGSGRALARFGRGPGGQFVPESVRPSLGAGPFGRGGDGFGAAPRAAFAPAPMPNHGFDRGAGGGGGPGRGGGGFGPARRGGEGGEAQPGRRGEGGEGQPGGGGGGGFRGPGR